MCRFVFVFFAILFGFGAWWDPRIVSFSVIVVIVGFAALVWL
jgi:hypothetical protein